MESYEFQPRIIPPRQHAPNPLSANIIDVEDENETGANNDIDNGDEVQELSPAIANAKKKAYVIVGV